MSQLRRRQRLLLVSLALIGLVIVALGQRRPWRLLYPIPYRAEVQRESVRSGIAPFLIAAVAKVESNWQPAAISRSGAIGLMQIMPDTGRWAAQKIGLDNFSEQSLYDPAISLRVGAWYLNELSQEFSGDTVVILAAYNAGRGNVRQWLATQRWSGNADEIALIPFSETRKFVSRVLATRDRMRWIYGDGFWR